MLAESVDPGAHWSKLKQRLVAEGSEVVTNCHGLKFPAPDGKQRVTDCANTEGLFRIIQSIPSHRAEPFKHWLAQMGYERVKEINKPVLTSARELYQVKGFPDDWIEKRLPSIAVRDVLTDEWKERGVTEGKEGPQLHAVMKPLLYLFLAVLLDSGAIHAASFDCNQARTRVEKLVCSHEKLSDFDEKLDAAYIEAKKEQKPPEANHRLTQEQLQWLRNVRNRCADKVCLEHAYRVRLDELDPFADKNLTCEEMRRWPRRVFRGGIDLGSGHGSPFEVDYGCPGGFGQLDFMLKLLALAERVRGDGGPQACTGTIVYAQWRYYQFELTQAGVAPRTLEPWSSKTGEADWKTFAKQDLSGTATYFRQWSEKSYSNQLTYAEFAKEFDQAATQLVKLYVNEHGMTSAEARSAAKVALGSVVNRAAGSASQSELHEEFELLQQLRSGPKSGAQVKTALSGLNSAEALRALKVALIYNHPTDVVVALSDAVGEQNLGVTHGLRGLEAVFDGYDQETIPEPLLSLALGNLDNLVYLLRKNVPVDDINGFGKTTLFYAIGAGNHAAVELLLRHKSNVQHTYKSAKELRPNDDECIYPRLLHTRRTTLMHAAQNSDVRMLKILLAAGASLHARDDLGFNAHDYALMGKNRENAIFLSSLGLVPAMRESNGPD